MMMMMMMMMQFSPQSSPMTLVFVG